MLTRCCVVSPGHFIWTNPSGMSTGQRFYLKGIQEQKIDPDPDPDSDPDTEDAAN
jgi:hypothetical protein